MITIKRLTECTLDEGMQAFNNGFADYYVPIKVNAEQFIAFMVNSRVSPVLSLIAFVDGQPAGFVLNGIRTIGGHKLARNCGTGVSSEFRRNGVGKALIEKSMEIYHQEDVDIAILEAFRINHRAIALYEQSGYEIVDHLQFWESTQSLESNPFAASTETDYQAIRGLSRDAGILPFYKSSVPWQNHWEHIADGESLLVQDRNGETIGYALYKRNLNQAGKLVSIALFQCEAAPERVDINDIIKFTLSNVFAPLDQACKRTTFNMPQSNAHVIQILKEAGFTPSHTSENVPLEQVHMFKRLK
jgi:GNAT superfamily N-acetyltransferase